MKQIPVFAAIFALAAVACVAQDGGYWRAASSPARTITGDIAISGKKVTINYISFPLVPARTLKPDELGSVFDADVNAGITGVLYRIKVPARSIFLHHNPLCGSEDTEWMATFVSGRSLQVAFFSGSDPPVFTMEAIGHSDTLCGTYIYAR